jgi:hypothetical protein
VVVGDQSSGKSSLLEGITGLAFPIASDLCTRFATQIVLRRAPAEEASIKVSILPGPEANADEDAKERLLNFGGTLENDKFDSESFTAILGEVGGSVTQRALIQSSDCHRHLSAWASRRQILEISKTWPNDSLMTCSRLKFPV